MRFYTFKLILAYKTWLFGVEWLYVVFLWTFVWWGKALFSDLISGMDLRPPKWQNLGFFAKARQCSVRKCSKGSQTSSYQNRMGCPPKIFNWKLRVFEYKPICWFLAIFPTKNRGKTLFSCAAFLYFQKWILRHNIVFRGHFHHMPFFP